MSKDTMGQDGQHTPISDAPASPFEEHNAPTESSCSAGGCGLRRARWLPSLFLLLVVGGFLAYRLAAGRTAPVPEVFDKTVSLQSALDESAQTGKPVFALLTADWCSACQSYKRGALVDQQVASTLREQTIPVYINVDTQKDDVQRLVDMGMPISPRGSISLPTSLIVKDGKVAAPLVGGHSASSLMTWLDPMIH